MSRSSAPAVATRVVRSPARGWLDLDLRGVWTHRELLFYFVWRDIRVRYRQTILGAGWAVLQPFLTMVAFTIVFGRLARLPSDDVPYPLFAYSALVPWMYFASALIQSTNSLVGHQALIKKVYFPRLILPAAAVLVGLADFTFAFLVLVVMLFVYGFVPGIGVLLLPGFLLLATLSALGLGLWLSVFNALYRDIRHAVPFLVQLGLFASPVVYPTSAVPDRWQWLYRLNPMVGVLDGFRWALLGRGAPPDVWVLASVAGTLLVLFGGVVCFKRMEATVVDVV